MRVVTHKKIPPLVLIKSYPIRKFIQPKKLDTGWPSLVQEKCDRPAAGLAIFPANKRAC